MQAVRYDGFGDVDVLDVRDVDTPAPAADAVLVRVRAAGINPGEAKIRTGALAAMFPSTFPSGQGSDLAGVITAVGDGVTDWSVGDEVVGWVDTRSSHAEYAVVPAAHLVARPASLAWEVAGAVFVAGSTAWAALDAVTAGAGDTVLVAGAAGGVGIIAAQLAAERGATVLGLAGPANHDWLAAHGVTPVDYSGGTQAVTERLRAAAPNGVQAAVDFVGGGYVDVALDLGVAPGRIDTVVDFAAAERGVRTAGSADGASARVIGELVARLADGRLDLPVRTYPLAEVRAAFTELEKGHTRGKIVLLP